MRHDQNLVALSGKLVDDPDLRYTNGGTAVVNIWLEVERTYKNDGEWQSSSDRFTLQAWGNLAEQMGNKYEDGDVIHVEGKLTQNSWEDGQGDRQYRTEVKVKDFGTISQASDPHPQPEPQPEPATQAPPQQQGGQNQQFPEETDDELPF